MGGSAFAPENLSTPRMPPHVYNSVLSRMETLLQPHFKNVGHALEAPAKQSYGDIDILVAEPVSMPAMDDTTIGAFLADILGAAKWKRTSGSTTFNLAVRWPRDLESTDASESDGTAPPRREAGVGVEVEVDSSGTADPNKNKPETQVEVEVEGTQPNGDIGTGTGTGTSTSLPHGMTTTTLTVALNSNTNTVSSNSTAENYIQVDITVCSTHSDFRWHLFLEAHGDLWSILGSIIRRYGLTCTSKGLFLRIAEIEAHNREQSRVKMTDDPTTVLEYLGLDVERYWRPFGTWDEMMRYAASCRFHDPGRWTERRKETEAEEKGTSGPPEKEETGNKNTLTNGTGNKNTLTIGTGMNTSNNETKKEALSNATAENTPTNGTDKTAFTNDGTEMNQTPLTNDTQKTILTNGTQQQDHPQSNPLLLHLKANDRQRAAKRPVFAYWIGQYLPTHQCDPPGKHAHLTRDQVVHDAKIYFGREFARRFDDRRTRWVRQIREDQLWAEIRRSLAATEGVATEVGYVMKGMKREIVGLGAGGGGAGEGGGDEWKENKAKEETAETSFVSDTIPATGGGGTTTASTLDQDGSTSDVRTAYLQGRFDFVLDWARTNWKEVGDRQKALDRQKSQAHFLQRRKRDQEKEEQK